MQRFWLAPAGEKSGTGSNRQIHYMATVLKQLELVPQKPNGLTALFHACEYNAVIVTMQ